MPYAVHTGIRIHYQAEGDGPAFVLQHGFASSLAAWRQCGYVNALRGTHRLILIDARGHGASDKPSTRDAYALACRVGDTLAVLDALRIERAHVFGFSMGGWIGFGMAKYAPARLRSLIALGAHPYADSTWRVFRGVDATDPVAFIAAHEASIGERIPSEIRPLVLANDLHALVASAQERPALEGAVRRWHGPRLLIAGEADVRYPEIRRYARATSYTRLVSLPGLTHIGSFLRSDAVVPHVTAFLESLSVEGARTGPTPGTARSA